jgi:hypothetical protein
MEAGWHNQHAHLHVTTADGQRWEIETSSVNYLRRLNAPIEIYEVGSTALADQPVADAAALGACRPKGMGGIMAVPAPMEFVDDDSSIARAIDAIEKSRSSIG